MPSALLALSLTVVITSALSAQSEERPAIFAPRPIAPETTGPGAAAPERPVARAATSDRMRLLLTERVLAAAKAFDAPQPAAGSETAAQPPTTAGPDGAVLMRQFFVRALPLRRDQVEPRAVPLFDFAPAARADRRAQGYSATLLRLFEGNAFINFNVVKGAGQGADSRREFTRFELEFSLKPGGRR